MYMNMPARTMCKVIVKANDGPGLRKRNGQFKGYKAPTWGLASSGEPMNCQGARAGVCHAAEHRHGCCAEDRRW